MGSGKQKKTSGTKQSDEKKNDPAVLLDYIKKNIYYLNTFELARVSDNLKIPYIIHAEKTPGTLKKTSKKDPKMVIIKRILKYIKSGTIDSPTIYRYNVMSGSQVQVGSGSKSGSKKDTLTKKSFIFYDTYKNGNHKIAKLMSDLTDGKFKFGTLSCEMLRNYWANGKLITFEKFATEWLKLSGSKKAHPEWRYIQDMKTKPEIVDWKKYRDQMAANVINSVSKYIGAK